MAVCAARAMILVVWNLLCFPAVASADQQLLDVTQAVNEIVAACAIGPTSALKEPLISRLEEFLQQSIKTKSAKSADLTALFGQFPTDTEEALAALKDERARKAFFAIYFNCIGHQVGLKLKTFGIDIEQ
jgi:hypothetical protein